MQTKEYRRIHHWLRREYGNADYCEKEECLGKSTTYDWALKKGKIYEYKRENFFQLCRSCHMLYDGTRKGYKISEETRSKLRESHLGLPVSKETREKLSKALKGKKRGPLSSQHKKKLSESHKGKKWSGEQREKFSKYVTSDETKKKLSDAAKRQWARKK